MILTRERWTLDGAVVVLELGCHAVYVFASWVTASGRLTGRISCTHAGCRKTFDELTLEGWSA